MTHGLQADGIECRGEGGEIVRNEKYLHQLAGHQDKNAQNKEANAAIMQYASQHDEGRKQRDAGKETEASRGFREGLRQKAGQAMDLSKTLQFIAVIETPHYLVPIGWLGPL